jgi:hypothetical protein
MAGIEGTMHSIVISIQQLNVRADRFNRFSGRETGDDIPGREK